MTSGDTAGSSQMPLVWFVKLVSANTSYGRSSSLKSRRSRSSDPLVPHPTQVTSRTRALRPWSLVTSVILVSLSALHPIRPSAAVADLTIPAPLNSERRRLTHTILPIKTHQFRRDACRWRSHLTVRTIPQQSELLRPSLPHLLH